VKRTWFCCSEDIVATIVLKSGVHVQKKVFHLFPHHTYRGMDIVITRDGFQTLVDIIITDPTRTNLVQCASTTTTHVATIVAQNKTRSYIKRTPRNDFIPFAIKTYGCFHLYFYSFFIYYVHASIIRH
jgi:hypothetical protein